MRDGEVPTRVRLARAKMQLLKRLDMCRRSLAVRVLGPPFQFKADNKNASTKRLFYI